MADDLRWLTDIERPIIIDDSSWQTKQAQVLALPRWSREPAPTTRKIFDWCRLSHEQRIERNQRKMPIESEAELAALRNHLVHDPVAYLWHFCYYRNRDEALRQVATPTPGQLVILWRFAKLLEANQPVRMDLLKARQGGFSWLFTNVCGWVIFFHRMIDGLAAAQDKQTSGRVFRYLRDAYDLLPPALRPEAQHSTRLELLLRRSDSPDDDDEEGEDDLGQESSLTVQTPGNDFVGTGQPIQLLHVSELGKWDKVCDTEVTYTSVVNAIQQRPMTFIFRESTAFGAESFWHREWKRSKKMGKPDHNGFTPIFIPWYFDPRNTARPPVGLESALYDRPDTEFGNEVNLRKRYGLGLPQLEWRRKKVAAQGADNPLGMQAQEHPDNDDDAWRFAGGKWFNVDDMEKLVLRTQTEMKTGLLRPVFVGDLLPRRDLGREARPLRADEHSNEWFTRRMGGLLCIYRWPDPTQDYVVGGDVADGLIGGDASCLFGYQRVGYDFEGKALMRLAFEWHGRGDDWWVAEAMYRLGWLYATGYGAERMPAMLAWERTGSGRNIARNLLMNMRGEQHEDAYPQMRMYKRIDAATVRQRPEKQYGIATSGVSKGAMLREWRAAAKEGHVQCNPELLQELGTLTVDERGLVDTQGRDRFMSSVMAVVAATSTPTIDPGGHLGMPEAQPFTGTWVLQQRKRQEEGQDDVDDRELF